jgi:hypothetical protein
MRSSLLASADFKQLVTEAKLSFSTRVVFRRSSYPIVFLCGGTKMWCARNKFRRNINTRTLDYHFFLAEDAARDITAHDEPRFLNLAEFETVIADISDCVMVFPESPGSFAELGLFAGSETIRKKLFIIGDLSHQGDSFINLGPVALANSEAVFRPALYGDFKTRKPDFSPVIEKLKARLPSQRRKKFEYRRFEDAKRQDRFFLAFELVRAFRFLTLADLMYLIDFIFGTCKEDELRTIVSLLCSSKCFVRVGPDLEFFAVAKNAEPFLDFVDWDISRFTMRASALYLQRDPNVYRPLIDDLA